MISHLSSHILLVCQMFLRGLAPCIPLGTNLNPNPSAVDDLIKKTESSLLVKQAIFNE